MGSGPQDIHRSERRLGLPLTILTNVSQWRRHSSGRYSKGRPDNHGSHAARQFYFQAHDELDYALQRICENNSLNSKADKKKLVTNTNHCGCVVNVNAEKGGN